MRDPLLEMRVTVCFGGNKDAGLAYKWERIVVG